MTPDDTHADRKIAKRLVSDAVTMAVSFYHIQRGYGATEARARIQATHYLRRKRNELKPAEAADMIDGALRAGDTHE